MIESTKFNHKKIKNNKNIKINIKKIFFKKFESSEDEK